MHWSLFAPAGAGESTTTFAGIAELGVAVLGSAVAAGADAGGGAPAGALAGVCACAAAHVRSTAKAPHARAKFKDIRASIVCFQKDRSDKEDGNSRQVSAGS